MGLSTSKLLKQIESTQDLSDSNSTNNPSTPVFRPDVRLSTLDPRSPSNFISRTPVQLLTVADKMLEKYDQLDETPMKHDCLLLGIDPRSPTTDFQRTPIVLNNCDMTKNIHNKNLEKVIHSDNTPKSKTNNFISSSKIIPPKLLESSPLQLTTDIHKRKSFVGLLETNIDFTETDIDIAYREKCKEHSDVPILKNKILVLKSENVDPRSPTTDFIRTPIQIVKKIGEIELNDAEDIDSLLDEHQISKAAKVKGVVPSNALENKFDESTFNDKCVETAKEELYKTDVENVNSEVCEDIKLTENVEVPVPIQEVLKVITDNVQIPDSAQSLHVSSTVRSAFDTTVPLVNLTVDVQELNKKLTDLIYEDEDVVVCPRIVKLKEYNERSPLRNRNVIEEDKKITKQKLKVNDKPRKYEPLISKIPIYHEKNRKTQCENTPPRKVIQSKQRNKKSCQWDNTDKTLYL